MKRFARKNGANLIHIFKYTSFKTPTEYFSETTELDRVFLAEAVEQYEKQKAEAMKS